MTNIPGTLEIVRENHPTFLPRTLETVVVPYDPETYATPMIVLRLINLGTQGDQIHAVVTQVEPGRELELLVVVLEQLVDTYRSALEA